METNRSTKKAAGLVLISALGLAVLFFLPRFRELKKNGDAGRKALPAPVEVMEITHGPITLRRILNGTLEARTEFMAAPKVGGRIERITVNLADPVERGQVVAKLDDDEFIQAVAQAKADLAVARANLAEARSALEISGREFERIRSLMQRGAASESQYDKALVEHAAKKARLEVAAAQVTRAEALLETANIRLGYTEVTADWSGGEDRRQVADRLVDEGHTVSANTPLLLIVELDPITGIIFVTEKDYARLKPGQTARLSTDAWPGEEFSGRIDRIAPVFREATRQARVELSVDNRRMRLKPGMFIRAMLELDHVADAAIVPEAAITRRGDAPGIFLVNETTMTVSWRPVTIGIREGDRVQIEAEGLGGRVVTLGHQLIDDGSAILIPAERGGASPPAGRDGGKAAAP